MSWLNLNDSLNNIKGQISSFASGVLTDGPDDDTTELQAARAKVEELQALVTKLNEENSRLKKQHSEDGYKINNDIHNVDNTNWSWDVSSPAKKEDSSIISGLQKQISDLENEKRDLINSLEQLDVDCQQTTDKLVTLKDSLQTDYNNLKFDFDKLKSENRSLREENEQVRLRNEEEMRRLEKDLEELRARERDEENSALQIIAKEDDGPDKNLQEEYDKLKADYEALLKKDSKLRNESSVSAEDFSKLDNILQGYETKVSLLEEELNNVKTVNRTNESELLRKFEDMKQKHDDIVQEKLDIHKKYIRIITENVKKYIEETNPLEFQQIESEQDPQISDFSKQVESIVKLLLDFKSKTETLENELYEMSEEKTRILTEKNYEIEKLLKNSEILSQEVITKSQTIKDYELECSALMKNNDMLIGELNNYKNSSGLQTISESNEDNMLLLESQLESATNQIKELKLTVSDLENLKQDVNLETQTELDYIKKQLNLTGTELSQMKTSYQELLVRYDKMEVEYNSLKKEYLDFETTCEFEKQELQAKVDELKSELENIEYQYLEEVETSKARKGNLLIANQKLEALNQSLQNRISMFEEETVNLEKKLKDVADEQNKNELYSRSLVEKLQNAKMSETSLKLQNDTIYKELQLSNEARNVAESNYKQVLGELEKFQNNFTESQTENDRLNKMIGKNDTPITIADDDGQSDSKLNLNTECEMKSNQLVLEDELVNCVKITDESEPFKLKEKELVAIKSQLEVMSKEKEDLLGQLEAFKNDSFIVKQLEEQIKELVSSRELLMSSLTAKHQESLTYHGEIQRLNQILAAETDKAYKLQNQLDAINGSDAIKSEEVKKKDAVIEKLTDQNNFLREKCEVLAQNLLQEQSNTQKIISERSTSTEREEVLAKKLERLQEHLVQIEENYTQELLNAEQRNSEMQAKVAEIEQREKNSSTMYTSVSIRANQQVETLQMQLQLVTNQRDELRKRMSDAEDENTRQSAALANLQFVLEQFQKDKEKDVHNETERIRKQISIEKQVQKELQNEIYNLKAQLEESKQGLQAAARLADQLEYSKRQAASMKQEFTKLQEKYSKMEESYNVLLKQTDSKVDKQLVKNLVLGFVSSNNNLNKDQQQILKIISTVLDFSEQELDKIRSNKSGDSSWWGSILFPSGNQQMSQQSLSEAFVRFLENESKPMVVPNLLNQSSISTASSSNRNTPRQSPGLLNEVVLPTFTDFAQNRNSSSILKDVLKDNS